MGAWGGGVFANDDAADWAGDLVDDGSPETVRATLAVAAERSTNDYLEAPEGSEALAAAEVVAAAAGQPVAADSYSEAALEWAARHPEVGAPEFVSLARAAVDRVDGADSELRELWLDDDDSDADAAREWTEAVADLRQRLAACRS